MMCEKCDSPEDHEKLELNEEKPSDIFPAWDRLEKAAAMHGMVISRLESDEDSESARWMAWVRREEPGSLAIGTYGAMGLTPQEALNTLSIMLEGMEVR
jgi:hypothetical protein